MGSEMCIRDRPEDDHADDGQNGNWHEDANHIDYWVLVNRHLDVNVVPSLHVEDIHMTILVFLLGLQCPQVSLVNAEHLRLAEVDFAGTEAYCPSVATGLGIFIGQDSVMVGEEVESIIGYLVLTHISTCRG